MMEASVKNKAKNITIALLSTALCLSGWERLRQYRQEKQLDRQTSAVYERVIRTTNIVRGLSDTVKQMIKQPDFRPKLLHDTAYLIRPVADTVAWALRLAAAETIHKKDMVPLRDTLYIYQQLAVKQAGEIAQLKEARKHVTLAVTKEAPDSAGNINDNADIVVHPYKHARSKGIFSPQVNFIRVYNKIDGGTVNGKPYYDFEQTNDEINQLLFQARSTYNFQNHAWQYGLGTELKLNRVSLNGAAFYNPTPAPGKRALTFSLGGRFDFYRIRFK